MVRLTCFLIFLATSCFANMTFEAGLGCSTDLRSPLKISQENESLVDVDASYITSTFYPAPFFVLRGRGSFDVVTLEAEWLHANLELRSLPSMIKTCKMNGFNLVFANYIYSARLGMIRFGVGGALPFVEMEVRDKEYQEFLLGGPALQLGLGGNYSMGESVHFFLDTKLVLSPISLKSSAIEVKMTYYGYYTLFGLGVSL